MRTSAFYFTTNIATILCLHVASAVITDDVYFTIDWAGSHQLAPSLEIDNLELGNSDPQSNKGLYIMSADSEKYYCLLPDDDEISKKTDSKAEYSGPNEESLLRPLVTQPACSYRLELYWTYELCHGRHLRQYHEEKDNKRQSVMQEYFLGRFPVPSAPTVQSVPLTTDNEKASPEKSGRIATKKVEGVEIPFYAVQYEDGTPCDLTDRPRRVSIQYVCHPEGNGEVYELKEVFTCEYEAVVLTRLLCPHPAYQQQKKPINNIVCQSVAGAPTQPQALRELQQTSPKEPRAVVVESERAVQVTAEVVQEDPLQTPVKKTLSPARDSYLRQQDRATSKAPKQDTSLLAEFVAGSYCLVGGNGWWRHELCHLHKVVQFHEDRKTGDRAEVVLGKWDRDAHIQWLADHPAKRPKTNPLLRKVVSHYYGAGDTCDVSNKPRFVEVKLKCVETDNINSLAIYLIEPNVCEYQLVVESPFFCELLKALDDNGLPPSPPSTDNQVPGP